MPGNIVHTGAVVTCSHGGQASPTVSNPRVKLNGMEAAMAPIPYKVVGCALPPPPGGNGPCVTGTWTTQSVRVKSNQMAFVLSDSMSTCAPTATPMMILGTQFRVKAQ